MWRSVCDQDQHFNCNCVYWLRTLCKRLVATEQLGAWEHTLFWAICKTPVMANYMSTGHHNVTWTPSFKNYSFNRTLIHGEYVKARLPDHLDQKKCKPKKKTKEWAIMYGKCVLNTLPVLEDICYCLYYCVSSIFVLPVHRLTVLC